MSLSAFSVYSVTLFLILEFSPMWAIGAFILILTPIIIIHELGHFWAARFFNIKVDEFGIGFPPRAATLFESKGTKFTLNWIPLGGFVRPAGEDDPTIEGGLAGASKTARFFTLAMGAIFNFIFAIVLFFTAYMMGPPALAIENLLEDMPAQQAGLQEGDILWEVNGEEISSIRVLQTAVRDSVGDFSGVTNVDSFRGDPLTLLVGRNGEDITMTMSPGLFVDVDEDGNELAPIPVIGVGLENVNSQGRFSFT